MALESENLKSTKEDGELSYEFKLDVCYSKRFKGKEGQNLK